MPSWLDRFRRIPLVSDWVPIEDYLSDEVALLTDGSAFAMFEVAGRAWETVAEDEIASWHQRLNTTMRNIGEDRLVMSVYVCRTVADETTLPDVSHPIPFVEALGHSYRDRLLDLTLYVNRLFVSFQLRPAQVGGEAVNAKKGRKRGAGEAASARRRRLEEICELAASELADYLPRRLRLKADGQRVRSEIEEAIVLATTGVNRPVWATAGRPGNTTFVEDVSFGRESIEIMGPAWTTYAAALGLREYPATTWPGMFDSLLAAPFRFTLFQSFRFLNTADGVSVLTRKQNKMVWAGDKAATQVAELTTAADLVQSGRMVMGQHNLTLTVFAPRAGGDIPYYRRLLDGLRRAGLPNSVRDAVRDVLDRITGGPEGNPLGSVVVEAWKALANTGATVARENKALMAAWLCQIPGNHRYRPRPGAVSSRNFAAMAALHNYTSGAARSRWGKAVAVLRTAGGTPYHFHWHDGEGEDANGNTLVTGEMGSGKSLTASFLMAMSARYAGIVALDHKRGCNILFAACGANYSILGDQKPAFAPLKALDNSPRSLEFLTELLRGCIMQGGWRDLTPEEDRLLALGIATVMELPPELRSVGEVRAFLGDDEDGAGARLTKWCWGEELGWVLDAPADRIDMSGDMNGFDTTALMDNRRARGPALLYLFHRIERRLDGRPLLILIDEGWQALQDEVFRPAINKAGRTIRSKNGILVFISQSPADMVHSGIASSIVEQCPNQMHFANPRASRSDYIDGLHRTAGEFEALSTVQKGSGRFLYCKGTESQILQLPLHGMDELAVLSASSVSLAIFDSIPEEVRRDPPRMLAEFHRRRAEHAVQRERVMS